MTIILYDSYKKYSSLVFPLEINTKIRKKTSWISYFYIPDSILILFVTLCHYGRRHDPQLIIFDLHLLWCHGKQLLISFSLSNLLPTNAICWQTFASNLMIQSSEQLAPYFPSEFLFWSLGMVLRWHQMCLDQGSRSSEEEI